MEDYWLQQKPQNLNLFLFFNNCRHLIKKTGIFPSDIQGILWFEVSENSPNSEATRYLSVKTDILKNQAQYVPQLCLEQEVGTNKIPFQPDFYDPMTLCYY